jgi:transposase
VALNWQDTENITFALRELLKRYQREKLCIIWDNARWHRSKELRNLLGKGNEFERIHLIWLPPYAPDKNPEEHVWKIGKAAVSNTTTSNLDSLKHVFESAISNKCFNYQITY